MRDTAPRFHLDDYRFHSVQAHIAVQSHEQNNTVEMWNAITRRVSLTNRRQAEVRTRVSSLSCLQQLYLELQQLTELRFSSRRLVLLFRQSNTVASPTHQFYLRAWNVRSCDERWAPCVHKTHAEEKGKDSSNPGVGCVYVWVSCVNERAVSTDTVIFPDPVMKPSRVFVFLFPGLLTEWENVNCNL